MTKKPRGDSKLKALLSDEQQKSLVDFLRAHSYGEAVVFCRDSLGTQTSEASLSEFYSWWHLARRLERTADFTSSLQPALATLPSLSANKKELMDALQMVFEARAAEQDDPKLFVALKGRRQIDRDLDLRERELNLSRDKFEFSAAAMVLKHADKVRPIVDGPGTNEEKIAGLRQALFSDLEDES